MRKSVLYFFQLISSLDHDEQQFVKHAFAGVSAYQKVRELIEASQRGMRQCHHCGPGHVYQHGKSDGLQCYRGVDCGRTCNARTRTPLARLRNKELWLQHPDLMQRSCVLRDVSRKMDISLTTAFRWRRRFSRWWEQDVPGILRELLKWMKLFSHSPKWLKSLERALCKRGGPAVKRGLFQRTGLYFHSTRSFRTLYGVSVRNGAGFRGMVNRESCPDHCGRFARCF